MKCPRCNAFMAITGLQDVDDDHDGKARNDDRRSDGGWKEVETQTIYKPHKTALQLRLPFNRKRIVAGCGGQKEY